MALDTRLGLIQKRILLAQHLFKTKTNWSSPLLGKNWFQTSCSHYSNY